MQRFLIIGLVLLILIVGGSTLFINLASKFTSWNTSQTALPLCSSDIHEAVIDLALTNNGKSVISVSAKDSQTGKVVLFGVIQPHQQKTEVVETGKTDIEGGMITYTLSQGFISITKVVSYDAVTGCNDINTIPTVQPTVITPNQTEGSHLPATGSPFILWSSLLGFIPVGYFFKKFAKKN